jgi:CubicO group peptidase (beta-lactamase class C family)
MRPTTDPSDYRAVGTLLDRLVANHIVPGANVLILRQGLEAYYHAAGMQDLAAGKPIQRDTIFRIFSMTKPVTAAAVMVLVDEGKLSLEDPVSRYVPEFADLRVYAGRKGDVIETTPARPMKVGDLLTHTAGFSYWFQPHSPVAALYDETAHAGRFEPWRFDPSLGGLEGLAKSLSQVPLVSQPGERWHYSMSLEVAGLVVQRVSGQPLDVFMKTKLFDPLGMGDTAFSVDPAKASRLASLYETTPQGGLRLVETGSESPLLKPVPGLSGGGGLTSTIDDYARFAEMLRNEGELDGRRVLSRKAVQEMMTNHLQPGQLSELPDLAAFGLGGSGDGLGFGLGGAVALAPPANGVPVPPGEYSWGGAASTTFWVDPSNQLVVVFMTQLIPPSPEMLRDKLHTAIYRTPRSPD